LAGVAAMGEGIWLTNPERRRVYRVGERAMQCVITTMQPFATLPVTTLETDERALGQAMLVMDQLIANTTGKLAAAKAKFAEYSATMSAATASEAARARVKHDADLLDVEEASA